MTLSSMLGDGYRFYRSPVLTNIDCAALRPIDDHARHLARVLASLSLARTRVADGETISSELRRAEQWLAMAAGLHYVDVEKHAYDEADAWCSSGYEYKDAHNSLASAYATEQIRLHYTWSAVERLLKVMHLPAVPPGHPKSPQARAAYLLEKQTGSDDLPSHYNCVYRHLRSHVLADDQLRVDERLPKTLEPDDAPAGALLVAGHALRNLPAHGDSDVPEPDEWGTHDEVSQRNLDPVLHAPRLAARGMLLSLQMLLGCTANEKVYSSLAPETGWWVSDGDDWRRENDPIARQLLASAHLAPPEADDKSWDDDGDEESEDDPVD